MRGSSGILRALIKWYWEILTVEVCLEIELNWRKEIVEELILNREVYWWKEIDSYVELRMGRGWAGITLSCLI